MVELGLIGIITFISILYKFLKNLLRIKLKVYNSIKLNEESGITEEDLKKIKSLSLNKKDVNFKSIKQSYVKDTVEGPEYIIDPDRSNKFFLNVNTLHFINKKRYL